MEARENPYAAPTTHGDLQRPARRNSRFQQLAWALIMSNNIAIVVLLSGLVGMRRSPDVVYWKLLTNISFFAGFLWCLVVWPVVTLGVWYTANRSDFESQYRVLRLTAFVMFVVWSAGVAVLGLLALLLS